MKNKYSNMDCVVPADWSTNNGLTEQQKDERLQKIQKEIKKKADEICTRRKDYASRLGNEIKEMKKKKVQLESIVHQIQEYIVVENDPNKRALTEKLCNDLLKSMGSYVSKLSELEKRFSNQKIRILSFGTKSQGKSSFTRAYTNLPEKVVDIKEEGETKDWTGTTSIFIHKSGVDANSPEIRVVFKRPQSIVDTVNYCFKRLRLSHHYDTWEQLYLVLKKNEIIDSGAVGQDAFQNEQKKELFNEIDSVTLTDESMTDLSEVKSTLLNIFKAQSDFSDIDKGDESFFDCSYGKAVSLDDLPQYNNMQNPDCQKYMSVSEIHVFADLKHNNMFENIEVCDTKGTSVDAGGEEYEKELYTIIGNSDAIFSIQMTGSQAVGDSDTGFYIRLNKARNTYKESLKYLDLRHFAIINIFDKAQQNCFDKVFQVLNENRMANTAYAGVLKEGAVYNGVKYSMQDFVDYVIHDMMKKIVITTNITDQKLLDETKSLKSGISAIQDALVKQLLIYDSIPPKNEDEIIHESIGRWLLAVGIPNVKNIIIESAKKVNAPISFMVKESSINEESLPNIQFNHAFGDVINTVNSDNVTSPLDKYAPTEKIIYKEAELGNIKQGIYEIITGDPKIPSEIDGKSEKEIVESAIMALFHQIKGEIGKKKGLYGSDIKGTWASVGSYIDDASILICRAIIDNVNRKFAPDQQLPGSQNFKDELYVKIWDCLKLNEIYQEFKGTILKKDDKKTKLENRRLDNWSIPYNLSATIPSSAPLLPPPSYVILKHYFDTQKNIDFDSCDYEQIVVKEQDLITAFQKAYVVFDFPTRYRSKKSEEFKWKTDLLQHLWTDIEDSASFSNEMIGLYKYSCPNDFVHKLTAAGIIDKSIEEECENQKRLQELKNQRRSLSSFSF